MKVLIAYATNSSGTLVASRKILEVLKKNNHEVTHKDIREVNPQTLVPFDLIVFGSPSWDYNKLEGQPHEFFSQFMAKMDGKVLPQKKFAIFGLGDTAYMYFCGAVDHLEKFVESLKGVLIVPSIRIDGFFFNQNENEKKLEEWTHNLVGTVSKAS